MTWQLTLFRLSDLPLPMNNRQQYTKGFSNPAVVMHSLDPSNIALFQGIVNRLTNL